VQFPPRSYLQSPLLSVILAACLPLACTGSLALLSGDAYVSTLEKKKNFGGAPILAVGPKDRALLQFNLSPIPSSITAAQIAKATLELWVEQVSAPGSIDVSPVASEWSELEVTAENTPQIAGSAVGQISVPKGRKRSFVSP
jgi:hypothetical protein